MPTPILTLLSDFGLKDPYVAEMKAVILTISPDVRIVDIGHMIEKFNVRMGAFVLASAAPYFPQGTVHVAVVDPGVGTRRRALLVETTRAYYVGPDNGLLMLAAKREGIQHAYAIARLELLLPQASSTFHGRDVFAPTAAYLTKRTPPVEFGSEITDYVVPEFTSPIVKDGAVTGEVLHIDDFGNIIANIVKKDLDKIDIELGEAITIKAPRKSLRTRFCETYGDARVKSVLALIGSHGFLEIAINQGNAAKKLGIRSGDSLTITR